MSEIRRLPAIIVKDAALLPGMIVNFTIIQKKVAASCEEAIKGDGLVFVASQKMPSEKVTKESLYEIGAVAFIRQINKLPDKSFQVMLESKVRARIVSVDADGGFFVDVEEVPDDESDIDRIEKEAMLRYLRELFLDLVSVKPGIAKNASKNMSDTESLGSTVDMIVVNTPLPYETKLMLLSLTNVRDRYEKTVTVLNDEIQVARVKDDLKNKVKEKVSKSQRDYYLREEMNSIRKELGEDPLSEEQELKDELEKLTASDEVKAKIEKEINRLSTLRDGGSEAQVERSYIETLLEMPWDKMSEDSNDIVKAKEILDRDHYGLEKVKERILEFLAVRTLTGKGGGPIICLIGPPGTGKTSIARSIADALNKQYVRVSLGGVRDEAEIRGHRRTYVGAMPGNIANGLKQAGVKNPLMLLDEIDKVSSDYKGDTSSALLEVLDSEQNSHFRDHYVGIPIDLSEVLFVATANSAGDIPRPLYDRMEIIEVSSYTENEKFHIAKDYLLKKQFEKNGLSEKKLSVNDAALKKIISFYTREAGVRELERKIGEICRKAAREILEEKVKKVSVTSKNLTDFLGKEKYRRESELKTDKIGIARGLAWTPVGGDTLQIEVNIMPGKGNVELTGQMGDVMKESAMAGISYIRSVAGKYKIEPDFFEKNDIHIHIPEGAVPKDGPSAGITMATAVLSAITKIPVSGRLAMTGEITLRGRVLPVGGLKEKILAAKNVGIHRVLVPEENKPDIEEISAEIRENMDIIYVSSMNEVTKEALVNK
ncbi:MAG: endopeptidase La [Lachnospiraceae bacterium]|nr:endopeptidase La [Lachnospiraceae bacterium]